MLIIVPFRRQLQFIMVLCSLFFFTEAATAQSTLIPLGNYSYHALDRFQIKSGHFAPSFDESIKPLGRKGAVLFIRHLDSLSNKEDTSLYLDKLQLSKVDRYHMRKILSDNGEWTPNHNGFLPSKNPLWKAFYKDKANLYKIDHPDFFIAVNPLIRLQAGTSNTDDKMDFIATRGVELRGMIAGKIGFYTSFTENQERPPLFLREQIKRTHAVPGIGFHKRLDNGGYDYLNATGYIAFNVTDYIHVQFGYGNNVFGVGYRSLFLSDNAPNYFFLKLNTHIWKLNYTNIFAELTLKDRQSNRVPYMKKYIALHRLGLDVTPWLNLGVFESITFGRPNHFELQYLNPVIFYRVSEQELGSPDNANMGVDAKAIIAHHVELYGQFLLDELKVKQMLNDNGWWGNKWALQLGAKYVDAFNIKNLDLQAEINVIRPYTYSHWDSLGSFSSYSQSLADPKGANLIEGVALARYQPINRLKFRLRVTLSQQGKDGRFTDWGGDILKSYNDKEKDFGNYIGQGLHDNIVNASFTATYELKHNLFVDLSYLHRQTSGAWTKLHPLESENCNMFSVGVRLNMGRRDYDY